MRSVGASLKVAVTVSHAGFLAGTEISTPNLLTHFNSGVPADRSTVKMKVQKMAYFLQEAGEPLRLRYEAGIYGPYAHNLNKVIEIMEGHFTRGYGDSQKPDVEIELLAGAIKEADDNLAGHDMSANRLDRVARLIEGFETPYGLELLSSVHWAAIHGTKPAANSDMAVQAVHEWNERKRRMFKPEHIHIAWNRLREHGWLDLVKKD